METGAKRGRLALAGILLSASVALGSCVDNRDNYSRRSPNTSEMQLRSPTRELNKSGIASGILDTIIPENKCEAEGLQRIVDLMRRSHFEVMLVYIPEGQPPDQCQWIEIGRGGYGVRTEDVIVNVDREYLSRLMTEHVTLHLYHYHPLVYFEQWTDEIICDGPSVSMPTGNVSEKALISNLRYSMPSPIDIAFMVDVSREFDRHGHEGGRIIHRVVTPYGIVEYSLGEEGKRRLEKYGMEGEAGRFGFDTFMKTLVSYALSEIDGIVKKYPNDIKRAMEQLVKSLNNEYLRVIYTPFGERIRVPRQRDPGERSQVIC
ncbi:MAG: hypothetical protein ACE5I0_08345 [Candidatus Binatia bacterium]